MQTFYFLLIPQSSPPKVRANFRYLQYNTADEIPEAFFTLTLCFISDSEQKV